MIALTPLGVDPAQQALTSQETLQEIHAGKSRLDAALAGAVSHGEQRILTDTNHSQLISDRADAVVRAIRDAIDWSARR